MSTATNVPPAVGASPAPVEPAAPQAPASSPVSTVAAPAPTAPAVTPAGRPDLAAAAKGISREDRQKIATGRFTPPAKVEPVAPVAAPAAAAPVAAPPVEPAAPIEPAAATPPVNPEAPLPDRFRFADDGDRLVALYAKQNKISLIEAAKRLSSADASAAPAAPASPSATPPAAAPAAPAVDPVLAEYDTKITAADAKIAELTKKREQLREDMDNAAADRIGDEIADLKADKRVLASEKKAAAEQRQNADAGAFDNEFAESSDRALTQFPVLGDSTSPHYLALQGYIGNLQRNPANAGFFKDPRWPELIAADYAEKYGIANGAATPVGSTPPATPPPPAPATPPRQPAAITPPKPTQVTATASSGAKMLTSAAGNTPAPSAPTPADMIAASRTDPKLRAELRKQVLTRRAP